MSVDLRVLKRPDDCKKVESAKRLLKFLEELREQAVAGKLIGLLVVQEDEEGYGYTRINMKYQDAIALHTRAVFKLNQDWDAS